MSLFLWPPGSFILSVDISIFILKGLSLDVFSDHEELLVCSVGAVGPVSDGY